MCLERNTWRTIGRSYTALLVGLLLVGAINHFPESLLFAQQSQDYINGMMDGQMKALAARIDNIEKLLYFLVTCTFGVLIAQVLGLRNQRADSAQHKTEWKRSQQTYNRYARDTGRPTEHDDDEED